MRRIPYSRILTGILLCAMCYSAAAQEIPLKFFHLTVDNGLSHTDTKDIKQDKQGFIWIATLFGLDRFDGYSIKQYYNDLDPKNNAFRNRIRSIFPDDDGKIWLATDAGIQCFDAATGKYLPIKNSAKDIENSNFTYIAKLKNGGILVLSQSKPYIYTLDNNQLTGAPIKIPATTYFHSATTDNAGDNWLVSDNSLWFLNNKNQLSQKIITDNGDVNSYRLWKLYFNKQGGIVLLSGRDILLPVRQPAINKNANTLPVHIAVNKCSTGTTGPFINDVVQDSHHNYWISADNGIQLYDAGLHFIQAITSKTSINGLSTNHVERLFIDRTQCLWIGTFGGGVNYLDLNAKLFYTIQHNPNLHNTLSGDHIRSVLEENGDKLWIGTNENGLNCYDFKTKLFKLYDTHSSPVALANNAVSSLALDKEGNLWIGTDKGIQILAKDRQHLLHPKGHEHFPNYSISNLAVDYYGNIWFGSNEQYMGLISKIADGFKVTHFDYGHFIFADDKTPQVFASSVVGVSHFLLNNDGSVSKRVNYHTNNTQYSLSSNYAYPIIKINNTALWVGTIGGGLNLVKLQSNGGYTATVYASKFGVFNDVESMQADNNGNIWMGTGKGLEKFDPITKKVTNYDNNDGLQGNSFKVGASCTGKNGRLYFGGINGLNYFYPDSIKTNAIAAQPVFTDVVINGKKDAINGSNEGPGKQISYSSALNFNYLQNNFVISFSAMHFANPSKCQYRYKLMGYDNEWKYTDGNNPDATYSNLDYSNYTFVVEAANNDGVWNSNRASVTISISPPWWKSVIAKIIYALLIISGLIYIYVYQARWFRLKREIAVRDVEEKKREEMHQQREDLYQQQLQFFTNISHEFRTPLTLILGPLENLIKENINPAYDHSLQVMHRNARRLINLINELMNFRKVADSAIKLHVMPLNLNEFINSMYNEFEDLAEKSAIEFNLTQTDGAAVNWLDQQIVEKILFNVLNNAFKYTPAGGKVALNVFFNFDEYRPAYETGYQLLNEYRAKRYVYFQVSDTGIGISKESISQIFDRYYRISSNHLGSGVGLALIKSLTLLHKGDIYVYSERHKGTEIIIGLPWEEKDYTVTEKGLDYQPDTSVKLEKIDNTVAMPLVKAQAPSQNGHPVNTAKKQILLVEDNDELRAFLRDILEPHYLVYEAANGKQGLQLAKSKMPGLVISDVMMPVMNGVELCRQLKETFETSHIPFMMLSAKDALDAKMEGMESGADYYFAKPLSTDLLLITIHNLFEQREKLKLKYTNDYYADATELVHSAKDKEFIDKFLQLIEANIQQPELDVDYLCQQLFTSRSKLYQKIRSISDQSVGDFIRTARLKKAVHIMTHEDLSINELIERIGFTSTSYFSKAFKKEFGKSPVQFLQSVRRNGHVVEG